MTGPVRIRLSRAKGFRLADISDNCKVVSRPSKFGNPFTLDWARLGHNPNLTNDEAREYVTHAYRSWLTDNNWARLSGLTERRAWILEHLHELRDKSLACWCPMPADGQEDHCHAAVLLTLANEAGAGQ